MSSKRPFFPLFFKNKDKLKYLSMEQRGELLTALFDYAAGGAIPEVNGIVGFAFEIFREVQTKTQRFLKKPNGFLMGKIKTQRNPTKPKKPKREERSQKREVRRKKIEVRRQKEKQKQKSAARARTLTLILMLMW